jgi:hypothetical protein
MAENTSESSAPPMPRGVGALMHHVRTHKIGTVPCTCHAKMLENVIYVCGVYCMTNNQCCGSGPDLAPDPAIFVSSSEQKSIFF